MVSNIKNRHDLPILDPDDDLLEKFEKSSCQQKKHTQNPGPEKPGQDRTILNRHGLPVLDSDMPVPSDSDEENFRSLLKDYLRQGRTGQKHRKKPAMPVKKRLKRYPPVEKQLDLHGCNAVTAAMRSESFIKNCKYQGYFTIKIITGRGLHSESGPVLPDVVEDVICMMKKNNLVLSYQWEKRKKSASGAVIIYLRQFEQFD